MYMFMFMFMYMYMFMYTCTNNWTHNIHLLIIWKSLREKQDCDYKRIENNWYQFTNTICIPAQNRLYDQVSKVSIKFMTKSETEMTEEYFVLCSSQQMFHSCDNMTIGRKVQQCWPHVSMYTKEIHRYRQCNPMRWKNFEFETKQR